VKEGPLPLDHNLRGSYLELRSFRFSQNVFEFVQGAASKWAAQRIRDSHFAAEFDAVQAAREDRPVYFTGEVSLDWTTSRSNVCIGNVDRLTRMKVELS
jgi:hypothetical protein